ncbi:MAG: hypothetical protein AB1791_15945 [Chloroflexota bacterium]
MGNGRPSLTGSFWLALVMTMAACQVRAKAGAATTVAAPPTEKVIQTATTAAPRLTPSAPTAAPSATPMATRATAVSALPTVALELAPDAPAFFLVAGPAVPGEQATAPYESEIRQAFQDIKALGANVVGQIFTPQSTEADWRFFFDLAYEEGLWVLPVFFDEPPVWRDTGFDLRVNGRFLKALAGHPALLAFFIVDEPFHRKHDFTINGERLALLYQQVKAIAPDTPVAVQFSREIARAESRANREYAFRPGLCDICIISALEFRNYGDGNQFRQADLERNHLLSRAAIAREAPQAQIWTTMQVFGSVKTTEGQGESTYYMPSAEELQQMVDVLFSPELQAAGPLSGIVLQQWASSTADMDRSQYTLGDPQFDAQRVIIQELARRVGLPVPVR